MLALERLSDDSPDRLMILFVKIHSGYYSCTRYTTKGIKGIQFQNLQ